MTKIILASFVGILLSLNLAQAEQSLEMQVIPRFTYATASLDVSSTGSANYSGSDLGADFVFKTVTEGAAGPGRYGLGLVGGFNSRKLDNTAGGSFTETYIGSIFNAGIRFYALNLYIGASLAYSSFDLNYTAGGTSTILEYSALGFRIETGIDLPLGNRFLIAPKFQYGIYNADQKNSSATRKLDDFGASIGLGVHF